MLGLISSLRVDAQKDVTDSLTQLNEVVITNTRLQNYAVGHYIQRVDSTTAAYASVGNAAELLRKFGFGHIRSYGVGGVTTPSFRGTGANHTAVLWNGINIVSPLLGQTDLSIFPVTFIDDIQLQSGGSASLYGSGAIAGTIQFNNKATFRQGLNVSLTENAGSFKTFFHGLSGSWSGERFISTTKVFQSSSENNFTFLNNYVTPAREEQRQHNAFEQHGVLQQNYFQINPQQLLSVRFWYQDNHYEVPEPASVKSAGTSTQRDKFFRSMASWNYEYSRGHLFVQSAHIHHLLDYQDPLTKIFSANAFDSFINTVENSLDVSEGLEWTSGVNYTYEQADGEEIGGHPSRNRVALYSAMRFEKGKWKSVLSAREERMSTRWSPFAPSLGVEYKINQKLSLFGNVSRNYRLPTFNDLYWRDASAVGNPGLKMERSWSEETGLKLSGPLQLQAAMFSNQVDNMIVWKQEKGKWTPQNVSKVWARGIETNGSYKRSLGNVVAEITARYSFSLSTTETGKKLSFTPTHESGASLRITYRSFDLSVTDNYTGMQYTDDSNNEINALKAYRITNLWLAKEVKANNITLLMMFELNNVFDATVSARPGYPLPGRNFKAGITLRFNKPKQI